MGNVEICYFTGTGNSLVVARDLAQRLDAKLTPVVSVGNQEGVNIEADVVGLVFPIYDFKPPSLVEDFIRKLEDLGSKYLFAVCTYGIGPAHSLKYSGQVINSCDGYLSAGFAVGMPHSGIGCGAVTKTERERMTRNWRARVEGICEYIRSNESGKIESSHLLFDILRPNVLRMVPSVLRFLKPMLLKGVDSMAFTADDSCNGCGMCERICLADNIEMVDSRPVWSDHCATCFACLHWCPERAISLGGLNLGVKPYHHPEVSISDMVRQKKSKAVAEGPEN